MATATLNYEPMVFNPKLGNEAPLTAIQEEMKGFKEKLYIAHSIYDLLHDFYRLRQGSRSNKEYYDEFTSLINTIKERVGSIADHEAIFKQVQKEKISSHQPVNKKKL